MSDGIKHYSCTLDEIEVAATPEELQKLTARIQQPLELEEKLCNKDPNTCKLKRQMWNAYKINEFLQKVKKPLKHSPTTVSELSLELADNILHDWFDLEKIPVESLEKSKLNIAKEIYKLLM